MSDISPRRDALLEAAEIIDGDRNVDYGDPIDDFRRTAAYWSIHAGAVFRRRLHEMGMSPSDSVQLQLAINLIDTLYDPWDVSIMMNLLKASRLSWSPHKKDHWVDTAGYAGCGWDCVVSSESDE